MASTVSAIGCNPSTPITCPNQVTEPNMNEHFSFFKNNPASSIRFSTNSSDFICSLLVLPVTRTSSKYTTTPAIPWNKLSITLCYIAGANDIPKGSILYWNSPLWVLITVYCFEEFSSSVCWYAWLIWNFVNVIHSYIPPPRVEKRSSILDIGYLSSYDTGFTIILNHRISSHFYLTCAQERLSLPNSKTLLVEEFLKKTSLWSSSSILLVHFDPSLEWILACDASLYGIRAVLAEKNYSQLYSCTRLINKSMPKCARLYYVYALHDWWWHHPYKVQVVQIPPTKHK